MKHKLIKYINENYDRSMKQFCKDYNLSYDTLRSYTKNRSKPAEKMEIKLCNIFKIDINELEELLNENK